MRAQAIIEAPSAIAVQETEGLMTAVTDKEVEHCAAMIIVAFLNPSKLNGDKKIEIILIGRSAASANWNYDRFVEALETRWKNPKFLNKFIWVKLQNQQQSLTSMERY